MKNYAIFSFNIAPFVVHYFQINRSPTQNANHKRVVILKPIFKDTVRERLKNCIKYLKKNSKLDIVINNYLVILGDPEVFNIHAFNAISIDVI